jgi:uncharacterized protein (TIGR00730 family)
MKKAKSPLKAYDNREFLHSRPGRNIRVLAEFSEPKYKFEKFNIHDLIVFFGSARTLPLKEAKKRFNALKTNPSSKRGQLQKAQNAVEMAQFYEDAAKLSRQLSKWLKTKSKTFAICSGGGPGIMEAVNKGAHASRFPSIGFNISLPFEQQPNPYISPELNFEFHYFFLRKFWFLYLAKAVIVFPGGFGTMDEMMEVLTLIQTKKLQKEMLVILYGGKFWKRVIDFNYLAEAGMILPSDLRHFHFCNDIDSAFSLVTEKMEKMLNQRSRFP